MLGLAGLLTSVLADPFPNPHGGYTATTDGCAACHRGHTSIGARILLDASAGNVFCNNCHDGVDAPLVATHGNIAIGGGEEDPFELECGQCHTPHGEGGNLYNIRAGVWINPLLGTVGVVTFTAITGTNSYDDGTNSGVCVICHINSDNQGYPMSSHPDGDHGPGKDYSGQDCTTCHLHSNGFVHGGGSGCITCHGHEAGTLYDPDATFPYTAGITASLGTGTSKSHSTHTEADSDDLRGPGIYCDSCHDINNFPNFNSGTDGNGDGKYNLAETDVCDTCHSPGGSYDGIDDALVGAKNNWDNGVYIGDNLMGGKEKWCVGCHDDDPSVIQSVSSPNIAGDEGATTNYGLGYGFYKTGHGLPADETYPASGGTVSGAGISCGYCHDLSMKHIDSVTRTYSYAAATGDADDYQNGYRLKYSMDIPRTDSGMPASDFELCFRCHASEPYLVETNYTTSFRDDPGVRNDHWYHLSTGGPYVDSWDSDWAGTGDSQISCPACHNVHGSSWLAMARDGKLINKEPGLRVVYYNPSVSYQCGGPGEHDPTPVNVTLPNSTGTVWDAGGIDVVNLCSNCHGSCGFDLVYYRNIPPQIISVQGQISSNILSVEFSEAVYSNAGAVGDLVPSDFSLTDLDNSRTITDVTHSAGQYTATLTLSSALDSTADIGVDSLAAATAATIFDATSTAMDTLSVTITGVVSAAQTLTLHPTSLISNTGCTPVGGVWADILDSNDGDTSYADCYSNFVAGGPGAGLFPAQFKVDLDDPSGLAGATIDQLIVGAWVDVSAITGAAEAYVQICYDIGGASQECSSVNALSASGGYVEIWIGNTVDPDGNPWDINSLNDLRVDVTLNAEDCCGDADATARITEVYAEVAYTLISDSDPPTISDQAPANGTSGVNIGSDLTFTLADSDSGVDWTTFQIELSGSKGYSELYTDADFFVVSKIGSSASYSVTVNPDVIFGDEEVITAVVDVDDLASNSLVSPVWSFTSTTGAVSQIITLHPSGVVTTGGFSITGGAWADVLDSNDGLTSYASKCGGPGYPLNQDSHFIVDMDDSGLAAVTIQSIEIGVRTKYRTSCGPSSDTSGLMDICYKTGASTICTEDVSVINDFSLYTSTHTTDSDGGDLDVTDIDNLQIDVRRKNAGSINLMVKVAKTPYP